MKTKPIFSGKGSAGMWKRINEARTVKDLRMALYVVACRCQELESEVKRRHNPGKQSSKSK